MAADSRPPASSRPFRPSRVWDRWRPSPRPSRDPLFRRSRRRIVAAILGVLIILVAGMVALIYATSYREVYSRNGRMLERYAAVYWEHGLPGTDAPPSSGDRTPEGMPVMDSYASQTFYAVVFDADGDVIDHAGNSSAGITEDTLATAGKSMADRYHVRWSAADAVTGSPDTLATGTLDQWMYRIEQYDGRTLVVMMDNTVMDENMATLMRYTAVFGAAAFALLAIAAWVFARLVMLPLERTHAEQRRFVADAGHELKTPVATIGVNAELLRRDVGDNPWLDNIEFENRRMGRLVTQLLELAHAEARVETGAAYDAGMSSVDLSRLVSGCLLAREPVAFEHGMRIEDRIDEHVTVRGDETQLGELTSILLDNAISHARPHESDAAAGDATDAAAPGVIHVTLRAERGQAVLRVSNPGSLSRNEIDHLFDRFYRADAAHSDSGGHYGLGLSIARAIVASHHGAIVCDSEAGRVAFTVRLPIG